MSEYKRFTEKIKIGKDTGNILNCQNCSKIQTCKNEVNYRNTCLRATIDRLAELEDKIENGTLIELPCKVGDTVWELDLFSKQKTREIKARNILQILHWIDDESFGKFLFLTKAEAEQRLKELKDER